MERDMELVRTILFKLEEKSTSSNVLCLPILDRDMETVAYHCKLMYQANLIDYYSEQRAGMGELAYFEVGNLTWIGHDFLDKIRENTVWSKTKSVIREKGLPLILDVVKEVSSAIIQGMTQAAIKSLTGQG